MNAVVGVMMRDAAKSGALCGQHWAMAKAQDADGVLNFFSIKRHARRCDVCRDVERNAKGK